MGAGVQSLCVSLCLTKVALLFHTDLSKYKTLACGGGGGLSAEAQSWLALGLHSSCTLVTAISCRRGIKMEIREGEMVKINVT